MSLIDRVDSRPLLSGDKGFTCRLLIFREHPSKKFVISILTALAHGNPSTLPSIRILTDRPEDYLGWPVETLALSPQLLSEWQGNNGYIHRRKACAIASGLKLAEKTLFVDTDTLFFADPDLLFKQIEPGQYLMDRLEYNSFITTSVRNAFSTPCMRISLPNTARLSARSWSSAAMTYHAPGHPHRPGGA